MSDKSLVVGLTGNIATGKSTILDYFSQKGAAIIDADKVAHRVMEPDTPGYKQVVRTFGATIVAEDGTIDRKALGNIVFSNPVKLGMLEKIVHPQVFELTRQEIAHTESPFIILEAIKLLEAGLTVTLCDEVWVVTAAFSQQLNRLTTYRGMSEDAARKIIGIQTPQGAKVNQADRVIDNNGSLEDLYAQLDEAWQALTKRYPDRLKALADSR